MEWVLVKLQCEKYIIYVFEWMYGGIWFDGFWRGLCIVVEVKVYYRQFFNSDGELQFWVVFDLKIEIIEESWIRQFNLYYVYVIMLGLFVRFEWYFLESGVVYG